MRHRVYGKKLGRNKNERTALFKSLVQELLLHGTITTSQAKAKALKGQIDKIINLAKSKNSKRLLQAYFAQDLQDRLVKEILPKLGTRTSGYTSMIRMGVQAGDNTTVVKMSLIGAEELKPFPPTSLRATAKQSNKNEEIATSPSVPRNDKKRVTKKATPAKKAGSTKRRLSKIKK